MQPIEIDGEDFREDDANDGGWNLVQRKSTGRKKTDAFEFLNRPRIAQDGGRVGAKSGRRIPALRRKVFAASRMPELPEEHQKIIVRPRNGLDLRKASHYGVSTAIFRAAGISSMEADTDVVCPNVVQNIVVVCTEKESNAKKLLRIKSISVNGKEHEVSVYAAAGDGFVKGVLRNVEPGISEVDLNALIVNRRNPLARQANRIKETGSVIVLFDGDEVPDYVRVGQTMYRCYLYKKQIEVCYNCARVGHRADVCPTPMLKVCRGCGITNPADGHECQARCKLCGIKGHPTGDKACKQRYQTPFIIRQRRRERSEARTFTSNPVDFPQLMPSGAAMTQQGWVQPFTVGGGPILPATATWANRHRPPETTRARQQQLQKEEGAAPKSQVSGGSSQEQKKEKEELEKIKEENAQLRELVGEMRKEMAELRAAISAPRQERDQASMVGRKRRAIGETPEPDGFEAFQQQISQTLARISEAITRIGTDIVDLKKQGTEQNRRICELEKKQGLMQRTNSQPNILMASGKPDGQSKPFSKNGGGR